MKTKKHIHLLATAALLALAACTQDETAIPTGETHATLPYGEYPLQIGGVTFDVESSAEPWSAEGPQTRVTEDNTDGKSSVWEWNGSEMIGVRLGNETATYTLNADKTLTSDNQLYWTSTAPTTVTAWYPTDETVNLSDQSNGLVYVLKATAENATYNNEITLGFKHQLAKVRVVLNGTQAALAQSVEVYGYTTCTNNEGAPIAGSTQDWIKMKHTTYADGTECWEANVVPGSITLDNFVRINGQTATINNAFPTTLAGGNMYTIDLTVGEEIIDLTAENCTNIHDDRNYRVCGAFPYNITVTGGNPTIYLENANISVENRTPISITNGANATIHVVGTSNNVSTTGYNSDSPGVYVDPNSTVTIEGNGTGDALTVQGGLGAAGIGGYTNSTGYGAPCGKIIIKNITLTAKSQGELNSNHAAGIGTSGDATIEYIEISNAVVYAQGGGNANQQGAAAIGGGINVFSYEGMKLLNIKISDSKIHATRGCPHASYIGAGGVNVAPAGYDIISTAAITDSHIYDESGNEITQ